MIEIICTSVVSSIIATILTILVKKALKRATWEADRCLAGWYGSSSGAGATCLIEAVRRTGLVEKGLQYDRNQLALIPVIDLTPQAMRNERVSWLGVRILVRKVRKLYRETLNSLPAEIILYRGVGIRSLQEIREGRYVPRSLESWTDCRSVAAAFGYGIITAKFPAEKILFSYKTLPYGMDYEQEFVVLTEGGYEAQID